VKSGRYAAMKFFLFTFAGKRSDVLGLLAIVALARQAISAPVRPWRDKAAEKLTFNISDLTRGLAERGKPLFTAFDHNQDNVLTREEAGVTDDPRDTAKREAFERLDTDGDGRLTVAEFRAGDARLELWIFLALFVRLCRQGAAFPAAHLAAAGPRAGAGGGSVLLAGVAAEDRQLRFCAVLPADGARGQRPNACLGAVAVGRGHRPMGRWWPWWQTDMKKLVAYSSVSHLGFCMVGCSR